ncbi:MAG TPA: ABC transporter permease [Acidimicrobiales bacterium]|nr:ABC transporter permease [Acidimicrobiales bacterium]
MRYALYAVVLALLALRVWRHLRARAAGTGAKSPDDVVPTGPVSALLDRFGGDVGLVARREVRERVRGRTFRIGTLVILLAVAAAVTIPVLRTGSHSHVRVGIVGTLSAPLRATVQGAGPAVGTKVTLVAEPSLSSATRALAAGRVDLLLVGTKRIVVDQGFDPSDTSTTALLVRVISGSVSLQAGLATAGIKPAQALRLANPPPLPVQSLKPPRRDQTARTTAVYGLILTYVLLTQFGTWLLIGVVEEKSSRVIEVLLSTLRAGQLLAGKVIGIGAVALLQAALIVAVALGLGAAEGSTLIHGTASLEIVSSLLWVVLGYAFYCWVYAAGGSLADRQEQVQSLAFPLQLPILFGYITSFTALGSGQPSELVKVLAYLPPTAPFAMPVLVGLGDVSWWGFTASVVIMLVATVAVARLAATVYRRAILRTGGRVHLRQLLAAHST